jgi:hypothetical protein
MVIRVHTLRAIRETMAGMGLEGKPLAVYGQEDSPGFVVSGLGEIADLTTHGDLLIDGADSPYADWLDPVLGHPITGISQWNLAALVLRDLGYPPEED